MEYIKAYIILYKSNTRVIYFCYMLNHTFILTGCLEVSVYTVGVGDMTKILYHDMTNFISR